MAFLRKLVRSAGFRYALLYTVALVCSVAAIGWLVEKAVTDALRVQTRGHVDREISALAVEFVHGGRADLEAALAGRPTGDEARQRFAIVETDGRIVLGDPKLAAFKPSASPSAHAFDDVDRTGSGQPVIVAAQALDDGTTLIVVDDLQSIQDVRAIVKQAFTTALFASAALGLVLGLFVSGALLRRVDAVTRTAEAIIAGDFARRIATTGSGDDFDRLARTFNRMLDWISGLMNNLRQVSNDVAHDLRTPLTRLQQGLQNANRRPSTNAEYRAAVDKAVTEIDGILDIFSALLRIAQIEAGARRAGFRAIDLSLVVRTVAEAYAPAIEDGGRRLICDIDPDMRVNGDKELLTQLFSNVCENALQHTPVGATIRIELRSIDGMARASIADDGPGIPVDERDKVLRRFYRVEKSRGTTGHGLGLTLVAAVADLHGCDLEIADNAPGLRVTATFAPSVA
ncbi:sensor histidine kinase [Methylobacterium haplocladii]|uniref:histidine kinase n=1 Tax=Methylobacterium haplocladii TaxID=1176176 RepID=A0A512IR45_9HYPH|nr:HAMP domain-containing sensor histidine kinase [Methylobacterium haplocladii]GEP00178.1 two-component sensor histidine kinase [Methylobacterium haplocladii]GJD83767.1 Adaptive-response sensory-kinase SasA [Methylobacterium haplocladii]GLS57976.1 two-component sensor histidine kinase [Methylobacterium haplocladii]